LKEYHEQCITDIVLFSREPWKLSLGKIIKNYLIDKSMTDIEQHLRCSTKIVHVFTEVQLRVTVRVMVFNATFNNMSVISWRSLLLVEETGVPGENHRPAASQWQILSHNVVSSTPRLSEIRTHNVSDDRHWLHR
jgi:hypothetical protein